MRVAWAAGLSLLLSIGFGNDAAAQTRAQLWANCNASDPDLRISGCTSLIQSNKETTDKRADAFNKRGIAYKDKGDYDRAIQDYDQAIRLSPKNAAAFDNAVHDLWLAVATGNPGYARPAFFPEKAYEQVKAIADPAADWENRLWYDFTLDLAAVHRLVRPGATLTKVVVPAQYAQWIPEGACYNSIGYWHVPGSRVVYRQDGTTYSFGLASFISWRGDWYLVHLGALSRGGAYGIVDDPQRGEGVPGPPGGC